MNKTLFTTVTEIKVLLGITGTDLDAALAMYLQAACNQICDLLGTYELMRFVVADELVEVQNENYLSTKFLPIDWNETLTVKTTFGATVTDTLYRQTGELRTIRRKDSNDNELIWGNKFYKVSYTAGFETVADVPTDLKMLAALITQAAVLKVDRSAMSRAGGNATENPGQLKRYSIGTKTVEYFDPNIKGGASGFGAGIDFEATLKEWASKFRKFNGYA